MKITIAYPFDGYKPEDVVDLDDAMAEQMIRDGKARPHTPKNAPAPAPTSKEA